MGRLSYLVSLCLIVEKCWINATNYDDRWRRNSESFTAKSKDQLRFAKGKCITGANIDNAAVSLTRPTYQVKKINCMFQNAHSNFAVSDVYLDKLDKFL